MRNLVCRIDDAALRRAMEDPWAAVRRILGREPDEMDAGRRIHDPETGRVFLIRDSGDPAAWRMAPRPLYRHQPALEEVLTVLVAARFLAGEAT